MGNPQYPKYAMKDGKTPLAESYFNPIWQSLDTRILAVEDIGERADAAVDDLVTAGLQRIDTYLAPAYENISSLAELGFLTATLDGDAPMTFALATQTVILNEGPERDQFRAAPYVTFQPESDYLKVAVARTLGYERETGALEVEILYMSDELAASPGPHTGIFVSAAAGSAIATINAVYAAQEAVEAASTLAGFVGAFAPGSYPTVRRDGSPLVAGDFIYDTTAKYVKAWDGDSFELAVGFSGSRTYRGTFGASPTGIIAVSTDVIDVAAFVNGAALKLGDEYTFTSGSGVVTITTPVAGDEYLLIASYRELPSDVAAQAAAAAASASAAASSASAASASATAASGSAAGALANKLATDAALAAASTGPVISINGIGGVVTGVMFLDGAQTVTAIKAFSVGAANAGTDFLALRPTDYGAGKPQLSFYKSTTTDLWSIGLWDGTDSDGTINIGAGAFTFNGVAVATATDLAGKLNASAYTAADVLSKLLTVDGASSGLDADLLDGLQGSAYALASAQAVSMIGSPVVVSAPVAQIVFSGIPSSGYAKYIMILEGIVTADASVNQNCRLHVSTDNGSTWKTAGGDYGGDGNNYLASFGVDGANHSSPGFNYSEVHIWGLGKASKRTTANVLMNNRYNNTPVYNFVSGNQNCMRLAAEQDNAIRVVTQNGANITAGRAMLLGVKES